MSFDATLLSEALVFSTQQHEIEAGGTHQIAVPMSATNGGFIVYEYLEASGEGVTFTIATPDKRLLLDELQPESSGKLTVPAGLNADVLMVQWANTEAWLAPVTIGYTLKVISMSAVRTRLEQRLLHAVVQGPVAMIAECVAGGASVRAVDANGHTPLLCAALASRADSVSALLQAGAPVDDTDRRGNTPLHLAALSGADVVTLDALLKHGSSINARNSDGATPLLIAAFRNAEVATTLLSAGADASVADERGNTALQLAAGQGRVELLVALLAAGAPPGARNARGETALSLAAARGAARIHVSCLGRALRSPCGRRIYPIFERGAMCKGVQAERRDRVKKGC